MTHQRQSAKSATRRGSPEAIQKRRVARKLNTLLTAGTAPSKKLDGRTAKRRQRLVEELIEGRKGEPLSPLTVVDHANQLLELGETIHSLKKQGVKVQKTQLTDELIETIHSVQKEYDFHPDAWKILGIDIAKIQASESNNCRKR